jgi:hypothetical protein
VDAPERKVVLVSKVGNVVDRLAEADPDIAIARRGVKALGPGVRNRLLEGKLRDIYELARAVVFPAGIPIELPPVV